MAPKKFAAASTLRSNPPTAIRASCRRYDNAAAQRPATSDLALADLPGAHQDAPSGARAANQDHAPHVTNPRFAQTRGLARKADHLEAKDHPARATNHLTAASNAANRAIVPANAQMHGSRQLNW